MNYTHLLTREERYQAWALLDAEYQLTPDCPAIGSQPEHGLAGNPAQPRPARLPLQAGTSVQSPLVVQSQQVVSGQP